MTALFDYPKAAAFGRVLPKNKIYEHADSGAALKDLFVAQVDQIIWKFKLAPETINLAATRAVTEIQIFCIGLRCAELDLDVLRAIDKAIPFPLIFELTWSGKVKMVAAFKRPSEADSAKWVVSDYFDGGWIDEGATRQPLPVALDLGGLYEHLLSPLVDKQAQPIVTGMAEASAPYIVGPEIAPMPLEARIALAEAIKTKAREVERITVRLMREKQFNTRVAINAELRAAVEAMRKLQEGQNG